jgi:HEAT repeat protein
MYARWGNDSYGQLAMHSLRMKGDLVASPFLEGMLSGGNQKIRRQIVLLLAEFQNPAALQELFVMLTENPQHLPEIALIAGITGQDVTERNDRVGYLRAWYRANFSRPQATWFLSALDEQGVEHSLNIEQLRGSGDLSALPELTRLLVDSKIPYLRSLAARVLRLITHEDFGAVSIHTDETRRRAIAERYLYLVDEVEKK